MVSSQTVLVVFQIGKLCLKEIQLGTAFDGWQARPPGTLICPVVPEQAVVSNHCPASAHRLQAHKQAAQGEAGFTWQEVTRFK